MAGGSRCSNGVPGMEQIEPTPVFDRVIMWSIYHPLPRLARYGVATSLIVATALLRAALITSILPWLLFVPVILVIGLLLGKGAGVYASVLAATFGALSIAVPGAPLWLTGPQWLACALFIVVTIGVVLLAAELRAGFRRARLLIADRERAHAELLDRNEQRELLHRELGHRMKNLLAVVQAIAGQTLRQAPDLHAASEALGARLAALGKATEVLTATEWQEADLYTLADATLGAHNGHAGRIRLDGPRIQFDPQKALALSLTLHELVTNATKYGALSNDTGTIDLQWSVHEGANPGEARFQLIWREAGGPPVEKPTRRGFGSVMIERSLRSYFRGETSIDYQPEGLVFTIDAPLAGARMEGE